MAGDSPTQEPATGADDPLNDTLAGFIARIADREPGPGGGAVAAAAVAMAAGLVTATARASRSDWPEAGGAAAQAELLRRRAAPLVEANAKVYEAAIVALGLPAGTSPTERDQTIGSSLERAAAVPLAIAETAADVAVLGAEVAEHGKHAVRADAVAACLLAEAGGRAAVQFVEVNLAVGAEDERVRRARQLVAAMSEARERVAGALL